MNVADGLIDPLFVIIILAHTVLHNHPSPGWRVDSH